ncbi:hypothetical protein ACFOND_02975 [Reinekea marina]|uniref:Uncharacterized protein n=1 Tax=Reinekea marina TaxID=1310421 RepID=A0ABV7WP29_9GAMM
MKKIESIIVAVALTLSLGYFVSQAQGTPMFSAFMLFIVLIGALTFQEKRIKKLEVILAKLSEQ